MSNEYSPLVLKGGRQAQAGPTDVLNIQHLPLDVIYLALKNLDKSVITTDGGEIRMTEERDLRTVEKHTWD